MTIERYRDGKRLWSAEDDEALRLAYPHERTDAIATRIGRTLASVYNRAAGLGLVKTEAYRASPDACRLRRDNSGGIPYRFTKGQTPFNKGLRRPGWGPGRMKTTQFKNGERRGRAARLWKPIGTERLCKDGYLERKVNDDLPLRRRWRAVHVLLWTEAHGPVPSGHALVFRNGDKADIRLDNLECLTRRALMLRNSVHNLPEPLAKTVQLLGALNRQLNRGARHAREEQDRRSAQSPVRDARSPEGQGRADGSGPGARGR